MNTFEIFLYEVASILERAGGVRGLALLSTLAALTAALPLRFGPSMLNPLLLIVYSAVAPLLAGNFTAQSFAATKARSRIVNSDDDARSTAMGKVLAATAWGFAWWVILMTVPLVTLNVSRRTLLLPPLASLLALAVFAAALAWFTASLGSVFSSGVASASSAQTLIRGLILLPVLLFAGSSTVLPEGVQAALYRSLSARNLPVTLCAVALVLALAGWPAVRKTAANVEELRHPLSILEEN
jgi:hypothetical protein